MRSHSSSHSSISHRSHTHSSISHNSHTHRSSHSSLSSRSHSRSSISKRKINSRAFKHHGISNAHAVAVGMATGININGSARGAHGAALHRSRAKRNSAFSSSKSRINKNRSIARNIRLSQRNRRYSAKRVNFEDFDGLEAEWNENNQKFMWIPILMFLIIFIMMFVFSFAIMRNVTMRFMK